MGKSKKIIIGTVSGITAAAVAVCGVLVWKHGSGTKDSDGLAYVCSVSEINTAVSSVSNMQFSGIVEPQEVKDIKVDLSNKVISEISVEEGDHVKVGDPLFKYDIESMQLELQQGEVEIERMNNEINSSQQEIEQLENEKYYADADDQLTYTTQIQSLQTDIDKNKYDIKTKEIELEKLKKTIKNATVKAEISGTVQSLKTVEQLQSDGSNVLMKIMSDGDFRVKCTISEQNMQFIHTEQEVQVHSRVDDSIWTGSITSIGSEAESKNNDNFYYGNGSDDEMTTASKYPFYVTLDSSDGLMLGQHILVTPDQGSTIKKDGIWLYSDYIITDEDDTCYVWAEGSGNKLEKRKVEIGQSDDIMGDCEIISGIDEDDKIAFPSDSYKEGMRTTENEEDIVNNENNGEPIEMPAIDDDMPMEDGDMSTEDGDMPVVDEDIENDVPLDAYSGVDVKGGAVDVN